MPRYMCQAVDGSGQWSAFSAADAEDAAILHAQRLRNDGDARQEFEIGVSPEGATDWRHFLIKLPAREDEAVKPLP